jgi:hypothetical protein
MSSEPDTKKPKMAAATGAEEVRKCIIKLCGKTMISGKSSSSSSSGGVLARWLIFF